MYDKKTGRKYIKILTLVISLGSRIVGDFYSLYIFVCFPRFKNEHEVLIRRMLVTNLLIKSTPNHSWENCWGLVERGILVVFKWLSPLSLNNKVE